MPNEMIEKAAKNLYESSGSDWIDDRWGDVVGPDEYTWDEVLQTYPSVAKAVRKSARAVIASLREPSEAMRLAGQEARRRSGGSLVDSWEAMIDAILTEERETR